MLYFQCLLADKLCFFVAYFVSALPLSRKLLILLSINQKVINIHD